MVRVGGAGSAFFCALLLLMLGTLGCSRGPSDAQLTSEAQSKIGADPGMQMTDVRVNVTNGIVTLSGTVRGEAERVAATEDASRVKGVQVVVNNLRVVDSSRPTEPKPTPRIVASIVTLQRSAKERSRPATTVSDVTPLPDRHRLPTSHGNPPEATTADGTPQSTLPIVTDPSDSFPKDASAATMTPAPVNALPQAASIATPPAPPERVVVPDGSMLSVRLLESVSSDVNQQGDKFIASLASPLMVGGRVVIPAEAGLQGKVVEVQSSGRFTGRSSLVLELTGVTYNGKSYQLHTGRYAKQGPSRDTRSVESIGGGAGVGAILGAILGGGKGAAIGAAIGAGVGTGVQARSKGSQIRLPAESMISFRLSTPLEVTPASVLQSVQNPDSDSSQDPFPDDRPVLKRRPGSGAADPSPDTSSPASAPVLQPRPN